MLTNFNLKKRRRMFRRLPFEDYNLYFIFPSRVTAGLGASWPGWWRHWMLFPSCHLESLESSASNQCAILSLWFPLPLYSIARDEHTPVATFLLGNYYCVNCILYERRWSYVSPSSDVGLCGLTTSIVLFSWTKGRTGILSCILCSWMWIEPPLII